MQGYVTRKGQQWYAVIYEGLDPTTGRERRRWHAAGRERRQAESLARQLADDENERRGHGRSRLTFAGFVSRHWLPAKQVQLRPTTIEGYERMLRLHILPELGSIALRDLRSETIQSFYGRLLLDGRHDNTGGLSAKTVHEIHAVIRNVLDDAVRPRPADVQPHLPGGRAPVRACPTPWPEGLERRTTARFPRLADGSAPSLVVFAGCLHRHASRGTRRTAMGRHRLRPPPAIGSCAPSSA